MELRGLRAFLVEDEALVLLTLEDMMADLGCEVVVSVQHVEEALRFAVDVAVDIALLDVNVGGTRIDAVARILAARGVPIVFVTGYECPSLPPGSENAVRVAKPFDAFQLAAGIREALERSSRAR